VELRARPAEKLRRLLVSLLALVALAPAAAEARPELRRPDSATRPPPAYRLSAREVVRIASRAQKVRAERPRHMVFRPTAYTRGPGRWQVSWFDPKHEVAQVRVDDATGVVLEQWTGDQVAWTMARGYEGAFGRKFNAPYVWIPLGLLFIAPFFDPRRPFRVLHLDLLVLLAFGISHVYFNRGEIDVSAPLVVPVLAYLLVRLLWTGFRPRSRPGPLVPLVPALWLALGILALVGFRVGLNVIDSNVIDVGYAGVIGADRIADGDPLYGAGFSKDVEHGDTYGPLSYLSYVPFEQTMPWSGRWDDLPAAHGAALAFDLLTLAGLMLLGARLRPGREGRELGLALGFAWASYPYALFALSTNSNDSLVGLLTVAAMLALTLAPARRGASAVATGVTLGLATAAKFAPVALLPLFARAVAGEGPGRRSGLKRGALLSLAVAATAAACFAPFVPDGGLRELYDRTAGYQAARPSPFSIWGQVDSLDAAQTAFRGLAAALALAVALVPRRRGPVQVAALGAAVLIAVQLGMSHWFYLYVVWFAPLALVAFFAPWRTPLGAESDTSDASRRERAPVAA
jgi:hypothetical protein